MTYALTPTAAKARSTARAYCICEATLSKANFTTHIDVEHGKCSTYLHAGFAHAEANEDCGGSLPLDVFSNEEERMRMVGGRYSQFLTLQYR